MNDTTETTAASSDILNTTETTPVSFVVVNTTTETIPVSSKYLLLWIENEHLHEKLYKDNSTNSARLFKNDIELTAGIDNAKIAWTYDDGSWSYKDFNDNIHLFKNGKELTAGIITNGILRHPQTQRWHYANNKNKYVELSY